MDGSAEGGPRRLATDGMTGDGDRGGLGDTSFSDLNLTTKSAPRTAGVEHPNSALALPKSRPCGILSALKSITNKRRFGREHVNDRGAESRTNSG